MIRPCLPAPRGVLSEFVIGRLRSPDVPLAVPAVWHSGDPLTDDDFALASVRRVRVALPRVRRRRRRLGVAPGLLAFRGGSSALFLDRLFEECGSSLRTATSRPICPTWSRTAGGPSLSAYMDEHGTLDEMREFASTARRTS